MPNIDDFEYIPIRDLPADEHKILLDSFCSGRDTLDAFLRHNAMEYANHNLTNTVLVRHAPSNGKLAAYFSLCAAEIKLSDSERVHIDYHGGVGSTLTSFPSIKITQLAVDTHFQRQGIGKLIIQSIEGLAFDSVIAARFLFVDAANEADILGFYERCGFMEGLHYESMAKHQNRRNTKALFKDILGIVLPE